MITIQTVDLSNASYMVSYDTCHLDTWECPIIPLPGHVDANCHRNISVLRFMSGMCYELPLHYKLPEHTMWDDTTLCSTK